MSGYSDPTAVWEAPSGVKVDPNDPTFTSEPIETDDESLPAIYLWSNSRDGDGIAYAMAEDGHVIGSHLCSHWGYMKHDLHDRPDRKERCENYYPDGYRLVVLMESRSLPPDEVLERNRVLGLADSDPSEP